MVNKIVKLAYNLKGKSVSYKSRDAAIKLKITKSSTISNGMTPSYEVESHHEGLPYVWFFSYGGHDAVQYIPNDLVKRIEDDLEASGISKLAITALQVFPEESAKTYARMMEQLYKDLPPMTDGALLSTRMSY